MANIPLAAIPNAPQTGSTAVPYDVGAVRAPNMSGAASIIGSAGQMLQQQTRPFEFFDGSAGLRVLGESGGMISAILGNFRESMARADDNRNLAAMDRLFSETMADHTERMMTRPEEEWLVSYQNDVLPKVREYLEGQKWTPSGRLRAEAAFDNLAGNNYARVKLSAAKSKIGKTRMESDGRLERAQMNNDFEAIEDQLANDEATGIRGPEETALIRNKLEADLRARAVESYISGDPIEAEKHFSAAAKAGKSETFPFLDAGQLAQKNRAATSAANAFRTQAFDVAMHGIDNNPIEWTPDLIDRYAEQNGLRVNQKQGLKAARSLFYADTETGRATLVNNYGELYKKVMAFDPDEDNRRDGALFAGLVEEIHRTLPTGYKDQMLQDLRRIKGEGRRDQDGTVARQLQKVDDLAAIGQFGDAGGWKTIKRNQGPGKSDTVKVPNDPERMEAVQNRMDRVRRDLLKWHRQNPGASEEDAEKQFQRIFQRARMEWDSPREPGFLRNLFGVLTWEGLTKD